MLDYENEWMLDECCMNVEHCENVITLHYIALSSFQTPLIPEVTSGASTIDILYEIQPTAPARRLATQQVGYDQK